ncbi:MerR family DNA-binding transcriptional regulator [Lactiplantibacillus plantarum]
MYSIGAVAKKTGISSYTLRYYDKAGLTPLCEA